MSERYNSITVTVKITDNGIGFNRAMLDSLCARLVKCANNGSKSRRISAITEPSEGKPVEAFWWPEA